MNRHGFLQAFVQGVVCLLLAPVAAYFKEYKLVFVPRVDNTAVAQMLDGGEYLSACVIQFEMNQDPWKRVRFEVILHG